MAPVNLLRRPETARHRVTRVVGATAIAAVAAAVIGGLGAPAGASLRHTAGRRVLTVPAGGSIGQQVRKARPGDVVVVSAGTYHEEVKIRTPGITLRGTDRNAVVLDGGFTLANGVAVSADDVAVENLTVRNYTQNGFVFIGPDAAERRGPVAPGAVYGSGPAVMRRFRASYVTAYDDGLYGIYAFAVRDGLIENAYVSGHPDSGIYVGQCDPCRTVVRHSAAVDNAIGYYGTNSSDVKVVQSEFRGNRLGIAPNSQRMEQLAPQARTVVAGNVVADNDNPATPPIPEGFFGGAPQKPHPWPDPGPFGARSGPAGARLGPTSRRRAAPRGGRSGGGDDGTRTHDPLLAKQVL